jgi:hypothetical protein
MATPTSAEILGSGFAVSAGVDTLTILVSVALIAGWTAAWLNWLFNGELRQFVVSKFPDRWISGTSRSDIQHMSQDEFMIFMCTVSGMPEFLRGVLTCPLCLSAHVAGVGAILAARTIYTAAGGSWEVIPLAWAAGAVIGFGSIKKHL